MTILQQEQSAIPLSSQGLRRVQALIKTSHQKPINLMTILPWEIGVNTKLRPKPPECSWIYGTPAWESLNDEQRHEVLWIETARDISMFIWLEQIIPPLYVGYTNTYRFSLSPEVYEYLMIFSKEEIVHTLMFRKYIDISQMQLFRPAGEGYGGMIQRLFSMPAIYGIMWTVMIEWAAELNALYCTQHSDIDPLTQSLFYEHHVEEIRHIAFGKQVVESFFATASEVEQKNIREFTNSCYSHFLGEFTYNAEISQHTSFPFPIKPEDTLEIEAIRSSENNQRLNEERFRPINQWFSSLGIYT